MCANALDLRSDLLQLEAAGIDFWHMDVMDGHFVPNLAMNFDVIRAIKGVTKAPIDAHLMVADPEKYLDSAAHAGVDYLSFHVETELFLTRMIAQIKDRGMKAGVAINPTTSLERIPYVLEQLDYVVIMTVEPGFAGQKFIEATLPKITDLVTMIEKIKPEVEIQVDGNMNVENAHKVLAAGAGIIVGGTSSIFHDGGSLSENLHQFRKAVQAKHWDQGI